MYDKNIVMMHLKRCQIVKNYNYFFIPQGKSIKLVWRMQEVKKEVRTKHKNK